MEPPQASIFAAVIYADRGTHEGATRRLQLSNSLVQANYVLHDLVFDSPATSARRRTLEVPRLSPCHHGMCNSLHQQAVFALALALDPKYEAALPKNNSAVPWRMLTCGPLLSYEIWEPNAAWVQSRCYASMVIDSGLPCGSSPYIACMHSPLAACFGGGLTGAEGCQVGSHAAYPRLGPGPYTAPVYNHRRPSK